MKPDLRLYIGKDVSVKVDRPLGTRHPSHHGLWYSVNYGFISGTVSGDGEPIDAHVLGVYEPVQETQGVVIAVVVRRDDSEDKLVVAPKGKVFTVDQISALVEFQERFFNIHVVV